MSHIDEGTLLALLDGELKGEERIRIEGHVGACQACAGVLAELRDASSRLESALALLDRPVPADATAWAVRKRAAARPAVSPRRALVRAAAMVLGFAAVGSAAIPDSPVREWATAAWRQGVAALTRAEEAQPAATVEEPALASESDQAPEAEAGLLVQPHGGRVVVAVEAPAQGLVARVRLVDGDRVAVRARGAAATARFRTAPGRVDVVTPGTGELVIDVPASLADVTVEVDGRVFVEKAGAELTVSGKRVDAHARDGVLVDLNPAGSVH